jgi:YHS domain-containing protein
LTLRSTVLLLAALLLGGLALADAPGNVTCPVETREDALPEFSLVHEGRRIYFCCEDCKHKFSKDPQAYLANLPPLPTASPASGPAGTAIPPGQPGHVHGADYAAWKELLEGTGLTSAPADSGWGRVALPALGVTLLLALLVARSRSTRVEGEASSTGPDARRIAWRPILLAAGIPTVLMLGFAHAWHDANERLQAVSEAQARLAQDAKAKRFLDLVHFATFSDFGSPPIPVKPPLSPRLAATYYRGNDERSSSLFNGGHYRTATFHVALRAGGQPVKPGDDVAARPLAIHLEIERAPFTPDHFFQPEPMSRVVLTANSDPSMDAQRAVPDRVGLRTLRPLWRWDAEYPLAAVTSSGKEVREGIVYVREQLAGGARFHYAIQYALRFEGGRVGATSDVWMGALYRTRKVLPHNLPLSEWFSHLPIPEIPAPQTTDPVLLGITEPQPGP